MNSRNEVKLCGTICESPAEAFEENRKKIYRTKIAVKRNSGTEDILQMLMGSVYAESIKKGDSVIAYGRICTKNIDGHLSVACKAHSIVKVDPKVSHCNNVDLEGRICKKPYYRNLGRREITNVILASNTGSHSYYVPVIVWGYDSREVAQMEVGEHLRIQGRLQSRKYIGSDFEEHLTYEVSSVQIKG